MVASGRAFQMGPRKRSERWTPPAAGRMVPLTASDLQRCARGGAFAPVGELVFSQVGARDRDYENTHCPLPSALEHGVNANLVETT